MNRASLVIMITMLAILLVGPDISQARVAQLLVNPGFEDGLTGWTVIDCPSSECTSSLIAVQSNIVYEGNNALYMYAETPYSTLNAFQIVKQSLPYSPATWYFSAYVYVDARYCPSTRENPTLGRAYIELYTPPEVYPYSVATFFIDYCYDDVNSTHASITVYTGNKYPAATLHVPDGWIHIAVYGDGNRITVLINGKTVATALQNGEPTEIRLKHMVMNTSGYVVFDDIEFWDISSLR